tara:strand:+ start:1053 stop:1748 length:696 start_codon:yes stop_codon:yes gene_type:complete
MEKFKNQPIIILGGFLISSQEYEEMADWLSSKTANTVHIIKVNKLEWLLTNWGFGWRKILNRLDNKVKELTKSSASGKVTLIGHSSGGVMLRLYLSDQSFKGRIYQGLNKANCLITLGSPHTAKKSTYLRRMVDQKYPGSFYSKQVKYISIAGEISIDDPYITKLTRLTADISYKSLWQEEKLKGDGLVPIKSALLNGSTQIIIDKTSHGSLFGENWYCSRVRLEEWWEKI